MNMYIAKKKSLTWGKWAVWFSKVTLFSVLSFLYIVCVWLPHSSRRQPLHLWVFHDSFQANGSAKSWWEGKYFLKVTQVRRVYILMIEKHFFLLMFYLDFFHNTYVLLLKIRKLWEYCLTCMLITWNIWAYQLAYCNNTKYWLNLWNWIEMKIGRHWKEDISVVKSYSLSKTTSTIQFLTGTPAEWSR